MILKCHRWFTIQMLAAMIVLFLCEFTVWICLFLALSVLFFSSKFDICQQD